MKEYFIKILLEEIKMTRVNFIMIYVIHKTPVLLKMTRILKPFLRRVIDVYSFFSKKIIIFFSQHIMMKSSRLEEDENI